MEKQKSQIPNPNELPNPKSQTGGKPYDIRERTFEFALQMLNIVSRLPREGYGSVVGSQLARCGTSVGANVEEADGSMTRPEKRKAFSIARKEARESRYWLRIIERAWRGTIPVREEIAEATEILYILSAILSKL